MLPLPALPGLDEGVQGYITYKCIYPMMRFRDASDDLSEKLGTAVISCFLSIGSLLCIPLWLVLT
jgi:hypothetical protein